jgi:hypothetical protein
VSVASAIDVFFRDLNKNPPRPVPAAGDIRNGEDRQEIAARPGYLSRILAVSGLPEEN